ncbi:hypothetical protein GCM10023405_36840 [Streptomonospora salina]
MREAIAAAASGGPLGEQVRRLDEAHAAATEEWRRQRQVKVRKMHEDGMTYRDIAREIGVSFGRVRQILDENLDDTPLPPTSE